MIAMTFDDGGLALSLRNAPQVTALQLQKFAYGVGNHMVGAVQRNIGEGGLIGRRTGTLARAITFTVTGSAGSFVIEIYPDPTKVPYGAIQELGGLITPKSAQALAIPLEAMLTPNGVARATAAQVRANPGAFGFKATFIPKGHNVVMAIPDGAKGVAAIPIFALAASVSIPAHGYLATTLTQETSWIADYLEQITDEEVTVLFGESA